MKKFFKKIWNGMDLPISMLISSFIFIILDVLLMFTSYNKGKASFDNNITFALAAVLGILILWQAFTVFGLLGKKIENIKNNVKIDDGLTCKNLKKAIISEFPYVLNILILIAITFFDMIKTHSGMTYFSMFLFWMASAALDIEWSISYFGEAIAKKLDKCSIVAKCEKEESDSEEK